MCACSTVSEKFQQEELILLILGPPARGGQQLCWRPHRGTDARWSTVAATAKNQLGGGAPETRFSRLARATVDVWVDVQEQFIVALELEAKAAGRERIVPISYSYRYAAIGEPVIVSPRPRAAEVSRATAATARP